MTNPTDSSGLDPNTPPKGLKAHLHREQLVSKPFRLGLDHLSPQVLVEMGALPYQGGLSIDKAAKERVAALRHHIDKALSGDQTVYGVNTGFGFLSDVKIAPEQLEDLQRNLIRSHACGVGDYTSDEVVRSLLVLRAHTFMIGYSAVSEECIEQIMSFLQHDILPVIPEQGSVGASGDLAPLAHLALGLIGEGECSYQGEIKPVAEVLNRLGIKPLSPKAKEGLSLINGTHYMSVLASYACLEAQFLYQSADIAAAMSLDGLRGSIKAFDLRVHQARPHPGQLQVAQNILALVNDEDEILKSHVDCAKVQDPYSFRCAAQVHGASRDTLSFVNDVINREINSATDNPLVFDNGDLVSAGNFHGQPIALAMDYLSIANAEIASISERRIEKLTNPNLSGLPAFVTENSGLNSGFMIPHVVAAALVSENKVLSHPASVDSIPTSADKEDHVSMGPIAARKARQICVNAAKVVAIELLTACQAIDLLKPLKPSPVLQFVYNKIRERSPYQEQDRSLHKDIEVLSESILRGDVVDWVNQKEQIIK